jgi:hypothetical protein
MSLDYSHETKRAGSWYARLPGVPDSEGEWTYLTSDPEQTCAICGGPIRAAQAAGYVKDNTVHARCYRPLPPEEDSPK